MVPLKQTLCQQQPVMMRDDHAPFPKAIIPLTHRFFYGCVFVDSDSALTRPLPEGEVPHSPFSLGEKVAEGRMRAKQSGLLTRKLGPGCLLNGE